VAYVKLSCIGWHEHATVHGVTGDQDALTLRRWVGQAVRRFRQQHGKRQDDVARSARTLGLTWTASKVAALERGDKALPAEELLLLPLVLAQAQCGQPSLADLLPQGSGTVRLGDQTTMPAAVLAQVVRGEDIDIREVDSPTIRESVAQIEAWAKEGGPKRMTSIFRAVMAVAPDRNSRELAAAESAAGDAERIAARRLSVPSLAIIAAALATWGHGLTQERDARAAQRAGPGASARTAQAARGHVTRELYRELAPALDRYHQAMANQGEES
jgi:hypothetical protein